MLSVIISMSLATQLSQKMLRQPTFLTLLTHLYSRFIQGICIPNSSFTVRVESALLKVTLVKVLTTRKPATWSMCCLQSVSPQQSPGLIVPIIISISGWLTSSADTMYIVICWILPLKFVMLIYVWAYEVIHRPTGLSSGWATNTIITNWLIISEISSS